MREVSTTPIFDRWIDGLRDIAGRAQILRRIVRMQHGNRGTVAAVGGGIWEMKVDTGPGYRVYYIERQSGEIVLLLCGGDKSSQARDIVQAKELAQVIRGDW